MGLRASLAFLALGLLGGSGISFAEERLSFKANPTQVQAVSGQTKTYDMRTFLKSQGSGGAIRWQLFGPNTLSWLSIDSANHLLTLSPPSGAQGTFTQGITVGEVNPPPGFDGGAIADLEISVVSNPVWSVPAVDLGKTPEGSGFVAVDLKRFVSDPNGGTVSITLDDPQAKFPRWLRLNADGTVTGIAVPGRADVGTFSGFNFIARSSSGGTASVPASGSVLFVFKAPKWVSNPIALPVAIEDARYRQDVSGPAFVSYNESPALSFEVYDGINRDWVSMSPQGLLTGVPLRPNKGNVSLLARVSTTFEGTVYKNETVLNFSVRLINKPPTWTQNLIVLPDGFTRQLYPNQDLKLFAKDPDEGANLTYTLVSWTGPGQAWASVASVAGIFSGTPLNANLGFHEWVVEVSDGEFRVPVKLQLTVKNRPPVWKNRPVVLKPNATEDSPYGASLAAFVTDPEGDPLTFTIVSNPTWAVINNQRLEGTPRREHTGLQTFQVRVTDDLSGGSDTVEVQVTVDKINKPPRWTQNPINLPDAPERAPYSQPLAPLVIDPDSGDTFKFEKIGGPAWAVVSPTTGEITGMPQRSDLGRGQFTIKVSDQGGLSDQATVFITVTKVPRAPLCQTPATLKDAFQDTLYGSDLKPFASDLDAEGISFQPSTLPAWLRVTADGKLSGTPAESDIGPFAAEFLVTNASGLSCSLQAKANVLRTNWPPQVKGPIEFSVKEREFFVRNLVPQFVSDPDAADKLTFTAINWPTWAALTATGSVTLRPLFAQISPPVYSLEFSVTDGKATSKGTVRVTVVRDPRAPQWTSDPILFSALAGTPFSGTLEDKVKDLDGLPLRFSVVSGPTSAWLTIDGQGRMNGLPAESDVGDNTYRVTATNDALGATVTVIVKVRSANKPPVWSRNPVVLPDAFVGENYAQSLSAFASDPDINDSVRFLLVSQSPWVFVTSAGLVIGTPSLSDLGLNRLTVRARDQRDGATEAEVQITVRSRGQKPKWTRDPIDLGTAFVATRFQFELRPLVIDPDGDALKFRKATAAPAWLTVSQEGQVSGTSAESDIGPYTTVFEVSDDGATWVPVNAFGKVQKKVIPPKLNLQNLFFTVKAGEVLKVNLNQPLYVTNPENSPLNFALLDGVSWTNMDSAGNLTLSPQTPQIGDYTFTLRIVGNSGATDQGPMRVKVIKGAEPIKWLEDPIRYKAIVNKAFSATLAGKVSNPDSLVLNFQKGSGAGWLQIDPATGALSGTPPKIGDDFFSVSLSANGQGPKLATLIISVGPDAPDSDSIRIDDPVPGARIDNLWVVDNSPDPCKGESCLIGALRESIDIYYRALAAARVEHYGIYLSSDACNFSKPISDSNGELLLRWDDRSWTRSFNSRISRSRGDKHFSSPLIAIWQFIDGPLMRVPKPYYEPKVPMEMFIATPSGDLYKNYTNSSVTGWQPARFLKYYQDEHLRAEKPLRISALGPDSSAAFQTITQGTQGKLYNVNSVSVDSAIRDYAEEVIFRAFVTAKKRVKLSKVPADPASLKLTLAGVVLQPNQWRYDAATNEVEVFWNLIDMSRLKPGDRLLIEYR
jgi:hypothetical protein